MSKPVIPPLSAEDLSRFCEFLYSRTGILYGENKRFYIERRLAERMTEVGAQRASPPISPFCAAAIRKQNS